MDWKSIVLFIISRLYGIISILLRPFIKINNNSILFWSWNSRQYSCNPKALSDYLSSNHNDEFKIFWSFKDNLKFPTEKKITPLKWGSWKYLRVAISCKFLVSNTRNDIETMLFYKRKKQVYIMTWHAGMSLKKIEKDCEYSIPKKYLKRSKTDSKMANLMISGSEFQTSLFRNSFWYEGEILNQGTPRNDILFSKLNNYRNNIIKTYGLDFESTIVLYAPTFRTNFDPDIISFDWIKLKSIIERKFKKPAILFVRLHPNISHLTQYLKFKFNNSDCINISEYPDIQELLVASDILITDYSSSMFDFALTGKPCFLFAKDRTAYDRGFYISLCDLPFDLAETETILENNIEAFDSKLYYSELQKFNHKINIYENGNACTSIYQWMINKKV